MREPTARIGLERESRAHEIVAAAQILEWVKRDVESAAEGAEIARWRLQRPRVRGEALLAQERCRNPVARCVAAMQWLGHGAEVGGETAGERGADPKHVGDR